MGNQIVIPSMGNWYLDFTRRQNYTIKSIIESGTFFLTLDCITQKGNRVIVKAYEYNEDLKNVNAVQTSILYFQNLNQVAIPNFIPYSQYYVQGPYAYLVRPKFEFTLTRRMEEFPPLAPIEKLWITYQILNSMKILHEDELLHGSIHPDNIFVSWNLEVYVSDIAPFKPSHIRHDQPQLFHHYFASAGRSNCYLAPEQILESDSLDLLLFNCGTFSMDTFSIGCVIYYIYTGEHLFNFTSLYSFKKGELDISDKLQVLPEPIKTLTINLISLNIDERGLYEGKVSNSFPSSFPQISNQFSELLLGDCDLHHLVSLTPAFSAIVENQEPSIRVLFANIFAYFLIKSNQIHYIVIFAQYFSEFIEPIDDTTILTKFLPYFCALFAINSQIVKSTALHCICSVLKSIDSIPESLSAFIPGYLLPILTRTTKNPSFEYKCAMAEVFPILIAEMYRLYPEGSYVISRYQKLINFIMVETKAVILNTFVRSLKHITHYGYSCFKIYFQIFMSSFNCRDTDYKLALLEIFKEFYDKSDETGTIQFSVLYKDIVPAFLGFASAEQSPWMLAGFFDFFIWLYDRKLLFPIDYPSIYDILSQLTYKEIPELNYAIHQIQKCFPPQYQVSTIPQFVMKIMDKSNQNDFLSYRRSNMINRPLKLSQPLLIKIGMKLEPKFFQSIKLSPVPIKSISPLYSFENIGCVTTNDGSIYKLSIDKHQYSAEKVLQHNKVVESITTMRNSPLTIFSDNSGQIFQIDFQKNHVSATSCSEKSKVLSLAPIDTNTFYSLTQSSLSIWDIRDPGRVKNVYFESLTASAMCNWLDNITSAVGFEEGLVTVIDTRIEIPLSLVVTESVKSLVPVVRNRCNFMVVSSECSSCYDAYSRDKEIQVDIKNTIGTSFDGGVILADSWDVHYIDTQSIYYSRMLHDRELLTEMSITETNPIHVIPIKSMLATSLHGHATRLSALSRGKDVFMSGDINGFVHIWSVSK